MLALILGSLIIFRSSLNSLYDSDGLVQLISVPSYSNATVSGLLTCDDWDGEKGGVLAFMVNDTLTLNANIDVSGKGFRGADPVLSEGYCANTDSVYFYRYLFPESSDSVGRKGEGVANNDTNYVKGISCWGNGGGGGNARFAGGGGGGNYSNGGQGGYEDTITCVQLNYLEEGSPTEPWEGLGGRGGQGLGFGTNDSTIFFGGGGGSGTRIASLTASTGGNGGGIIVILAKHIKANGYQMVSKGTDVTDIVTASGGGGGGGTIVFYIDSVEGDFTLSVVGG